MTGEIAHKGKMPLQAGKRWPVERTNAWHNNFNRACAQPDHLGHGPRFLWARTVRGRKTRGRQLAVEEVAKVRRELEAYRGFAALTEQIAEVSEAICEARPASPPGAAGERLAADGHAGGRAQLPGEDVHV